jgi:hypothetical protein
MRVTPQRHLYHTFIIHYHAAIMPLSSTPAQLLAVSRVWEIQRLRAGLTVLQTAGGLDPGTDQERET